jgi:hypothetical protein
MQAMGVTYRVAKHLKKDRLGEAIEKAECAFALAVQFIRLVQDRRDPPLLGERGEREFGFPNLC